MKSKVVRKAEKGGFRVGSGRNPLFKEPLVSLSLSMRAEDRAMLEKIGKANGGASLSNSVRVVLDFYRKHNASKKKAAPKHTPVVAQAEPVSDVALD